ncbi:MAG: hypothetical protein ABIR17_07080 [Pseudolysinimonas sp.]|uniref:hypothetical protein n=1 Tax=Pseudolysinimonas sp. TaxID=2680009 RepID=UPI003266C612
MLKKFLASLASLTLALGLAATTGALASNAVAVDDHDGQCITDSTVHPAVLKVSHDEFQYDQVIPGTESTNHTEYRYRTRTVTYGDVEHKYILSTWDFVSGGTTTIDGIPVSGHWLNLGGSPTWHAIADSVINAVWSSSGIPDNLIGGSEASPKGSVPLSVYGAPGSAGSASYYATKVSNPSGFTNWGPWSAWSTVNPGADSDTLDVESQDVSNNDGTPDVTLYYLTGGTSSTSLSDANWTADKQATVGDAWTLIHQRNVVDVEGADAYTTYTYGTCPSDPCVSQSSTWFTESGDVAPTQSAGGLRFAGPNVAPVDYLHYVSGNLEGVVGSSYTITSASGYHAALVYEIWRTGTTGFATISIEPYNNGWAPGQTGTFTVTNLTKVWTSKIANPGLGSQANPATIDQMSAIYPTNTLIAQGVHLGSNSIAGQFTTVSHVTGCGSISFVDPPVISCDSNVHDGNMYLPGIEGVLWSVNGGTPTAGPVVVPLSLSNVTIDSSPASAAYKFGAGQTHWVFEANDNGICQIPTLASFPTNAGHTDQTCNGGTAVDGTITVGEVDGAPYFSPYVDYFLDGSLTPMTTQTVTVKPGVHTVTAAPHDPDDTLDGETSWSITIASSDKVCTDLTTLAFTGSASPAPWVALGALLLTAGLALIVMRSRRQEMTDAE